MSLRFSDLRPPRWLLFAAGIMVVLSWVPVALIAKARTTKSTRPRVALIQHMTDQYKFKPQADNPLFADGRAMRPAVPGAVPHGPDRGEAIETGRENGAFVTAMPVEVGPAMIRRGREQFDIYCSPCHGLAGYGDGLVSRRADELSEGTWTPPSSLHADPANTRPNGHIFNTITNGIRNMPGYGSQIPVDDRWAIVAYVRALQRSQNARPEDVPADRRASLR